MIFHVFYLELDVKTNLQSWRLFKAFYGALLLEHPDFVSEKTVVRMMGVNLQQEVRMEGRTYFPLQKTPPYRTVWRELFAVM